MRTIVVVPTYNEAENLPRLVPALLAHGPPDLELLIVDDASPDGTGQCADELARAWPGRMTVLHRRGPRGLGHAYLEGIRVALDAGADVVGQMDADLSHPPEAMPSLLAALERHEAVIGSRYVQGGRVDPRWPLWRKALSAFGNFYARTILGMSVHDVTGGYRLYRRTALLRMPLARVSSNGYVFQVEMTYIAHLSGVRFQEVPIVFTDRQWGRSKMSFRTQLEAVWRVWYVRLAYRDLARRA